MEEAPKIGLRCHIDYGQKRAKMPIDEGDEGDEPQPTPNLNIEFVFDTETRTKFSQNMTFGACKIYFKGKERESVVFYDPEELTPAEIDIVKTHSPRLGAKAVTVQEWVEKYFYRYVLKLRAACIGLNLSFDLRSLGIHFGRARNRSKNKLKVRLNRRAGISIKISDNPYRPRIKIVSRDSKGAFIKFAKSTSKNQVKNYVYYPGCFVDVRTLLYALTDKAYSLKRAAKDFKCDYQKKDAGEYGAVTPEHIEYCLNDVDTTYNVFQKAKERYNLFHLHEPYDELVSTASVGKAYLRYMGIRSFREQNSDFPDDLQGLVNGSYYGGRSEVLIRKQSVNVCYLDFLSMYPTQHRLFHMDDFMKADHIDYWDTTAETQEKLNNFQLADIRDPTKWTEITICLLRPSGDVLPVRAKYNGVTYNIGLNTVTSDVLMPYNIQDLFGSKLHTSRASIIERAVTFTWVGRQTDLKAIEVLPGLTVSPEEDFIKKLIEERQRLKKLMKTKTGADREQLNILQNSLKIIANATSYGIYNELNPKDVKKQHVRVHGMSIFETDVERIEVEGAAYNPLIATAITAGARLMLTATQVLLERNGGYLAACDTDGVFISPEHKGLIQDFFQPLNPYDDKTMKVFKVEDDGKAPVSKSADYEDDDEDDAEDEDKDKEAKPIENSLFYGISAKRYAIYDYDPATDKITIRKYSLHGLGHIVGINKKQVWEDIIHISMHPEERETTLSKYDGKIAVSRLRISSYQVLQRFNKFNEHRRKRNRTKPFNFMLIGTGCETDPDTGKLIIPVWEYAHRKSKKFKQLEHETFVDLNSGNTYGSKKVDTSKYCKKLREVIEAYMIHPESKLEGNEGKLTRRHLHITKDAIRFIGKETNELGKDAPNGADPDDTIELFDIEALIPVLKPDDADKIGITRRTLYNHQTALKSGEHIYPKTSVHEKYTKYFNKLLL